MSRRPALPATRPLLASLATGIACGLLPVVAAPLPAYAVERRQDRTCMEIEDLGTEDTYLTDNANVPLDLLGIAELHERLGGEERAGEGVAVAVVDSGVYRESPLLEVVPGASFANKTELLDYHGTAVAGLVAGRSRDGELTGVAPGARIVDVRVYDDDVDPDEGGVAVEPGRVVQGLEWVADNAERLGIRVAVAAVAIERSPRLAAVVRRLHREEDVVVVAPSGNRPLDDTSPMFTEFGELAPGEDAARAIFPAGYRDVVAVNATVGGHPEEAAGLDPRTFVLQNSATDVAAPTYGAVTLGLNGSTCLLVPEPATSWAAAEVAGLVAVLRARFPKENADQVVARLRQTASGAPGDVHVLVGAGIVQPMDAIVRRLTPDRRGDLDPLPAADPTIPPAQAPVPDADLLEPSRHRAVWWGLLGGAVVVLALLLRPLVARKR